MEKSKKLYKSILYNIKHLKKNNHELRGENNIFYKKNNELEKKIIDLEQKQKKIAGRNIFF